MRTHDFVIVGSGINSLVCAALLGKKGHKVCVLERNDRLGGCIRTEEITQPGFLHEVFSAVHPLVFASPWYPELAEELAENGVEYCNNDKPTAVVLPNGRNVILKTDRQANKATLDEVSAGDGEKYFGFMQQLDQNAPLIFGLLGGQLWSFATFKLLFGEARRRGLLGLSKFVGEAMQTSRDWLETHFKSDLSHALMSPWILHAGLGPESAVSGIMNQVMMYTLEQTGCPMVKGGNEKLVEALVKIIEDNGGTCKIDSHVDQVIVENGQATGVRMDSGMTEMARKGVICNTTPNQLFNGLLSTNDVSEDIRTQAREFRFGRGMMIIHVAMEEEPVWTDPALKDVVMLHVSSGLDGVSKAVNEADRGLLPEQPTIVVCQPVTIDPSRAPKGKWILWIQLQEIPRELKGDAKKEIETPDNGLWNEQVREQYADRVIEQLSVSITNLNSSMLERKVYGPADLEAMNVNLEGGDAYSGTCSIDQNLIWRPLRGTKNHQTPVKCLFQIGASTHPGPGLGGGSGFLVAQKVG
jgi:phytoene dehydrogenase-like protein